VTRQSSLKSCRTPLILSKLTHRSVLFKESHSQFWPMSLTRRQQDSLTSRHRLSLTTAALTYRLSICKDVHMRPRSLFHKIVSFSHLFTAEWASIKSSASRTSLASLWNTNGASLKNTSMKLTYSRQKRFWCQTKCKKFLLLLLLSRKRITRSLCLLSQRTYLTIQSTTLGFSILGPDFCKPSKAFNQRGSFK